MSSAVRRRGFTLLEVLIATGLILALFGSMFTFLFDLLSVRERALDHAAKQLAATTLIERVEADLMSCLVGDDARGAGIEGNSTRLKILTRAVAGSLARRGVNDPAVFGDLQSAQYRFDDPSGHIEIARGPAGGQARARPAAREAARGAASTDARNAREPNGDRMETGGTFTSVGGPVFLVRFRYHDGSGWRDSFDSLAADRLPVAVEVAVWFDPWPGIRPPPDPGDSLRPQRLTFDADDAFDERAFARESDLELFDEPMPDRIRVIAVLDPLGPVEDEGDPSPETQEGLLARRP